MKILFASNSRVSLPQYGLYEKEREGKGKRKRKEKREEKRARESGRKRGWRRLRERKMGKGKK